MHERRTDFSFLKSARWPIMIFSSIILLWWISFPSFSHRFRLSVLVNDNGVVRDMSGVFEVTTHMAPAFLRDINYGSEAPHLRGDALVLNLGARGVLIMTLRGIGKYRPELMAFLTFGHVPSFDGDRRRELSVMSSLHGTADVPPEHLWTFIALRDKNDPTSMKAVDIKDLSATFGQNVSFSDAKIEMTNDPVTDDIGRELPWLAQVRPGSTIGPKGEGINLGFQTYEFRSE